MNIAIVGTGISGLTAAYILNRKHNLSIFEKNDYIGGHTHTHSIRDGEESIHIDSGFIVFNEKTYPNFIKLLKVLEVECQKTTMGFSVRSNIKNLEYAGNSLKSIFVQKRNLFKISFIRMLLDILRFNNSAKKDLNILSNKITLHTYLNNRNYSNEFIENYIVPMGAAIWSTKADYILDIPALFFIKFFYNHDLLRIFNRSDWWVIKGGSKKYVDKIINNFQSKIRLNTPVNSIRRYKNKIFIKSGNSEKEEVFDSVVIASHSDQALNMLYDPSNNESDILGALTYQKNKAILHTDINTLPKRKKAWASWNYDLDSKVNKPVALTYNMNILQKLKLLNTYCVTLNSNKVINKNKVIKELEYEHPLVTLDSIDAQKRKDEISGINNTFYCGAYWNNGFHEDGVKSALDVCKHFELEL